MRCDNCPFDIESGCDAEITEMDRDGIVGREFCTSRFTGNHVCQVSGKDKPSWKRVDQPCTVYRLFVELFLICGGYTQSLGVGDAWKIALEIEISGRGDPVCHAWIEYCPRFHSYAPVRIDFRMCRRTHHIRPD